MSGKVYFISAPGRIKIGYTLKPELRLKQLRDVDMEPLTVIGIADGTMYIEHKLHNILSSHRLRGEWFTDCPEVRSVINDFIAGKLKFDKFGKPLEAELPGEGFEPSKYLDVIVGGRQIALTNSICEANAIMDEVKERLERHEPVSDLVKRAKFLATEVIAPLLHGGLDRA